MVCLVYSSESPRWGDSNVYTQHTISWWNKKMSLNIGFLELRTQKWVRISQWIGISFRAIGVRAIEVWLDITKKEGLSQHFLALFYPWTHVPLFRRKVNIRKKEVYQDCVRLPERPRLFAKQKPSFRSVVAIFGGSERLQTILRLSFGTTKMATGANKIYVCLFVTKNMRMRWYYSFDSV